MISRLPARTGQCSAAPRHRPLPVGWRAGLAQARRPWQRHVALPLPAGQAGRPPAPAGAASRAQPRRAGGHRHR